MDAKIQSIAEKKIKAKQKRKIWQKCVAIVSCAIVFCTSYMLILPAITMEHDTPFCALEAHMHDESCFEESKALVCGLEEAEDIIHTHNDSCYATESVLKCAITEHTHSLVCFSNPEADIESAAVWERSISDAQLTGVWGYDIVAVAKTQLGYAESTSNYIVDENEQIHGYTRYGAWYGDPYRDWCAVFVSFCVNYAGVPRTEVPISSNCADWMSSLVGLGLWKNRADTAEPGDIVFLDMSQDGTADQVGVVEYIDADASMVHTIEGNQGDAVARTQYPASSQYVLGYGDVSKAYANYLARNIADASADESEALTLTEGDEDKLVEDELLSSLYIGGTSMLSDEDPFTISGEITGVGSYEGAEGSGTSICYYRFIPTFTHSYVFESTLDSGDSCAYLYDSTGAQLVYDDNSSGDSNFRIVYELISGGTYYLGIQYVDSGTTPIPFTVSCSENHTFNEGVCACGVIGSWLTDTAWWSLENGVLTIYGNGAIPDFRSASNEPWYEEHSNIRAVVIENGITNIPKFAFSLCNNLTSVEIPDSVTSIGGYAFNSCSSLTSIEIPDSVANIGGYAFNSCTGLAYVEVPDNVTSIGSYTFNGCTGLTSVSIPDSVTSIGSNAFYGCRSLTSIIIPERVTSLGYASFWGCTGLTSVTIPDSVTSIEGNTFYNCSSLTSITIPDSVTSIGSYAFSGCSSLTSVTIPDSVTTIKDFAFNGCKGLSSVTIPGSLTSIGKGVFMACSGLTSITIPDSVTNIGDSAFRDCTGLTFIEIPDGVTSIGTTAFASCSNLRELTLSCDLDALSPTAFDRCQQLNKITLDHSTLSCGGTSKLSLLNSAPEIVIGENVDEITAEVLDSIDGPKITFVGENTFTLVEDATVGRTLLPAGNYYADQNGVLYRMVNGQALLSYCPPGIQSYTVPATIKVESTEYIVSGVGNSAISNADSLTTLTFERPENITSFGVTALGDCMTLTSVNGETSWQGAAALFINADPPASDSTFFRTNLWDNAVDIITDPTDTQTDDNRNVKLEITTDDTLLTGEYARATLQIDKGDLDSNTYVRLYFFINGDNYTVPYQLGELQFSAGNGSYVTGRFCVTDHPDVFYLEIDPLRAGDTMDLNIAYRYDNVISAGGDIYLDLKLLSSEERDALGSSMPSISSAYKTTWVTQENPFTLSESYYYYNYGLLYGDGTADGDLSVRQLQYQTSLKLGSDLSAYGTDNLLSVDFTQTLELPEGFSWKEGLLEAVETSNYRYSNGNFYVTIAGEEYHVMQVTTSFSNYSFSVNDVGKLELHYTYQNPDPSKEPSIPTMYTYYNNAGVIIADKNKIDEDLSDSGETITYEFENKVDALLHYTYGEDAVLNTYYKIPVAVGQADYALSKSGGYLYMGGNGTFTISLKNTSSGSTSYPLPCTGFDYVNDPLPYQHYIKAENMQLMFDDDYGRDLVITISKATLCTPVSHTVTGTDGQEYEITQQYEGDGTSHNGKTSVDGSVITSNATIVIAWNDSKSNLEMTVDGGSPTSIGEGMDYPSIEAALNGIGYTVTKNAKYTPQWDMRGLTLYSGQTVELKILVTAKDSFMILEGDQDWYLTSNTQIGDIYNYAYSYNQDGTRKTARTTSRLYRDFTLSKGAYRDGQELSDNAETRPGDIITYTNTVNNLTYNSTKIPVLPLVDHMSGSQILLVTVKDNPSLSDLELETISDSGGVLYYILNQPGVYENIMVGTELADRVVITASEGGNPDTVIYWYIASAATKAVNYHALVRDSNNAALFSLANEVWLGDHASHRLYDQTYMNGSLLEMNKYVVSENGDDDVSSNDTLVSRSTLQSGETVSYRLMVAGDGSATISVPGTAMYDILPAGVDGFNWTSDRISVRYVAEPGSVITIDCGDESYAYDEDTPLVLDDPDGSTWFISNTRPGAESASENQQYLCWKDDLSITVNGKLYIYVTLHFPDGDAWGDYIHAYGSSQVRNTFYVYHLSMDVTHDLAATAEAWLQKGVYDSGLAMEYGTNRFSYTANRDTNGRMTYVNESLVHGYVRYYVMICNTGESRLYLSEIEDVLPQGFTFQTMNTSYWKGTYSYSGSTLTSGFTMPSGVTLKSAAVTASTENIGDGYQRVTFNIRSTQLYDEELGRYYLNANEAVVFSYFCNTNGQADTADAANNTAAMKFYDYNGAGLHVSEAPGITPSTISTALPNDGICEVMSNAQAELIGMTGGSTETQWLTSNVTVVRGHIAPGIVKKSTKDFATSTEELPWEVTVSNSGTLNMYDYTLSDVMMAQYQHEGLVSYNLTYRTGAVESGAAWRTVASDLFTIGQRTPGDFSVSITSNGTTKTLTVNGDPVELRPKFSYNNGSTTTSTTATIYVSIVRDEETSQETLIIRFADDKLALSPNGTGILMLQTKNRSSLQENKSFINVCYVTPSQEFDQSNITRGQYEFYNGQDSVESEAQVPVSFGYATSAMKQVQELDAESINLAKSNETQNYIVLQDGTHNFRYTLSVSNTGGDTEAVSIEKLVVLDNLPEMDDHVTCYDEFKRYSEFRVDFSDNPNVTVAVNGTPLSADQYSVEFSDSTSFVNDDWQPGGNPEAWYSNIQESSRSIRVVILDDTRTVMPGNALITVSFDAKIPEDVVVSPSQIAWNSFGYQYRLSGRTMDLQSAPDKVGVRIAGVPNLTKILQDVYGKTYPAEEDTTFRFLIVQGTGGVSLNTAGEPAGLGGKAFTCVSVTVPTGQSQSDSVELQGLHVYKYEDGIFSETDTDWVWNHGTKYTLIELPTDAYAFDNINNMSTGSYTFSYNNSLNQRLACTNTFKTWNVRVIKQDADTKEYLSGAVFGLYSPNADDQMTEEEFKAKNRSLNANLEWEEVSTTAHEGSTWYLTALQTTEPTGITQYGYLTGEKYLVKELSAPAGYNLLPDIFLTIQPESGIGTVTVSVPNTQSYSLPESGGMGTSLFYVVGGLLVACAAVLLVVKKRMNRAEH